MMKRRIFLWMGLIVLFVTFGFSQEGFAKEYYKVRRGDTLAKISKQLGVNLQVLKKTNNLASNAIKPNQLLVIPQKQSKKKIVASPKAKSASYVVKKGDNLYTIAKNTGHSIGEIKKINHLRGNSLRPGQRLALSKPPGIKKTSPKKDDQDIKDGEVAKVSDDVEEEGDEDIPIDVSAKVDRDNHANLQTLGKWQSRDEQKLFVKVVMGFLGTPYRLGGQSIRGLDCSAFVRKIYDLFDISLPRTAREQAHQGMTVARGDLVEGDLVFFNTRRAFGHVGIYIGNDKFIHASSRDREVKIDSLNSDYYNRHFIKAVRVKELDEEGV